MSCDLYRGALRSWKYLCFSLSVKIQWAVCLHLPDSAWWLQDSVINLSSHLSSLAWPLADGYNATVTYTFPWHRYYSYKDTTSSAWSLRHAFIPTCPSHLHDWQGHGYYVSQPLPFAHSHIPTFPSPFLPFPHTFLVMTKVQPCHYLLLTPSG